MNFFSRLDLRQMTALAVTWAIFLPPLPLAASTRKGDKLWGDARVEEGKGNLDKALASAEQAYEQDPSDVGYQLELRRVRFEAGEMHIKNGQKLRNAGKLSESLAEFEKAYGIDPSSDIAVQEIKRTRAMIQRNANPSAAPGTAPPPTAEEKEEDKTLTPAELARKQQQERTDLLLPVPVLRPIRTDLLDLRMSNARPRVMFETWGKLAGINVMFDPEYDTAQTIRTQSIDLERTTLEQGLDQIALVTKSFWKPLNENTIFVTVDNPTKRRDYTEQVVKVFYLSNVTAPQEMQEMLTVIRTVVDVQKVFSFASQNALVVRADADTMALVEKLVSDLDKPRSEVIIDVMVMEVNSTHMRNITAAYAATGFQTSAIFAPRPGITTPGIQNQTNNNNGSTTTTTGTTSTTTTPTTTPVTNPGTNPTGTPTTTAIPLNALSRISSADFSITNLPGAALEAVLNDSFTKVLQAPQIRAVDNVKASLKIGEKVPTASGSFQPGVAGVGVSPLVNTQFTYLDVGVNMEVLPKVHENNEVSLHLDLDISQVDNYQNLGGISEPQIGQNKETADVRLREGEVNLIGGIIQRTDTKTKTGIPGLANIPLLGRLFSGEQLQDNKNELVIALIPHIVRGPDITESNLRGVMAGSQQQIKVSYGARAAAPAAPATGPAAVVQPAQPGPIAATTTPAIAAPPATAPLVTAPPVTAASSLPRISFQPATGETQLGSTVTVTISGENINNLHSAAAQLRFDPRILRINNIVAGDLPQRGIAETSRSEPSKNILNDSGQADVSVDRGQGGGISGAGGLFTVTFQAVGRGNTTVSVGSVTLKNPAGQAIPVTAPPPLPVNVK